MSRDALPDFDTLLALASTDPQALEQLRLRLCEQVIEASPPAQQMRLRGLQFQIDCRRRIAGSAADACSQIGTMMDAAVEQLCSALQGAGPQPRAADRRAEVLAFAPPRQALLSRAGH